MYGLNLLSRIIPIHLIFCTGKSFSIMYRASIQQPPFRVDLSVGDQSGTQAYCYLSHSRRLEGVDFIPQ
jgi:hypothetical protein